MDLPGYGFAKVPGRIRADWPKMIEGYLQRREGLASVIVLIDAEIGPTPLDVSTLAWLRELGVPIRVVATKQDKVKSSKRDKRKRDLAEGCGLATRDVLWVSASKNVNIVELRRRVRSWVRFEDDDDPDDPDGRS
jgi:GTP-binding protein